MPQFKKYSKYYDCLYCSKDYKKETDFILEVLNKFSKKKVKTILSLGCGTGTYEIILSLKGYNIVALDLSPDMLEIAENKSREKKLKIKFLQEDVRSCRLNRKFDAVMAMFNIAGYQNTDKDFDQFFKTAEFHLNKNGLLFFDAWNKEAVVYNKPRDREKIINISDTHKIIRKTTQKLNREKNIININFKVKELKNNNIINQVSESHPMRFFGINEIKYFLEKNNFKLLSACKFMNLDVPISKEFWDMFIVAQRI